MASNLKISFVATPKSVAYPMIVLASSEGEKNPPKLSASAKKADKETDGAITRAIKEAKFKATAGQSLTVRTHKGTVIIIGSGKKITAGKVAEDLGGHVAGAISAAKLSSATLFTDSNDAAIVKSIALGAELASYGFSRYFTKGDKAKPKERALAIASSLGSAIASKFKQDSELAEGVFLSRNLTTEPANVLYPASFAERCKPLSKHGVKVKIMGEAALKKAGMNLLLSVGDGSRKESHLVEMRWNGGKAGEKPIVLIGKGVCFDSGGISIKPAGGMEDMKWDMGGASAVVGAMRSVAGRKLKRNVVGLIGLVENMPDGNATRPGDVISSLSGQTVEIINTDAEGRLVLADVLTYAQKQFKAKKIVNLATLTGAIIVSLGHEYGGLFCNNDDLAKALQAAGDETGERVWRMPLGKEYDEQLKSHIADMKNVGSRWGGAITAACFLERFVGEGVAWAHIDIAGMAWSDKSKPTVPKGGTGYGVRLLTRLIENGA